MMTVRGSTSRVVVSSLISAALVALFSGSALALPSTNSAYQGGGGGGGGAAGYTNTDARTATDFHFFYQLANGDATPPYSFDSATFTTIPAGTVVATPTLVGGLIKGYTVNVTGLSIPTGGTIQVNANAVVSGGLNTAEMGGWTFTYPTGPAVSCGPDWRWRYQYDAIQPYPGPHTVHYLLFNEDLTRTLTLSPVEFRLDTLWRPAGTALPSVTPFFTSGPNVLGPGTKMDVYLSVPGTGSSKSVIYASGTMNFTGTGGGSPIKFDNRHQEAFLPVVVPSLTTWGMIAVALILTVLACVAVVSRKREAIAVV